MYIREQANLVQLIRTTYDPAIKRGRQVVFARFPDSTIAPADVRSLCTADEIAQLDDYLAAKLAAVTAAKFEQNLEIGHRLIDNITAATVALSVKKEAVTLANQLWNSSLELQKALKSAGFPKPAKPKAIKLTPPLAPEANV